MRLSYQRTWVLVALLLLVSCTSDEPTAPGAARMMRLAEKDLSDCRRLPTMRRACPTQVPAIEAEVGHRAGTNSVGRGDEAAYIFDAEWGAPYRNDLNERDRPPRFAHLVVMGGDVGAFASFRPSRDLGSRAWNGRDGRVVLAPPYPRGGVNGSHLVFRWEENGNDYALSLHAWEPLEQAEAALRETVLSLP